MPDCEARRRDADGTDGADEASLAAAWQKPRLTRGTLFVLGAMNLIDCINVCLLTPYVDRMVSDFLGRPTDDARVVQTCGLLIGLYSLCEVVFSPLWGVLADRFGRRPIMLVGLAGSAMAPVLLGLAPSLPLAFVARGLDGFFCGNVGVTKTYLGEIVDSSNEARGFSFLAVCFSLGLVVGPVLGGQLVEPARWAPGVFGGTIFERSPYLLPNLAYACFAAVAWCLGFLFLKETLPPWARRAARAGRGGARGASLLQPASEAAQPPRRLDATMLRFIFAYCLLSGYYAAWTQSFALITALPRSIHGFGLGPHEIGAVTNAAGVGLLSTQLLLYPCLTDRWGFLPCFVAGALGNLAVTLPFPLYALMADPARFGVWRYLPLAAMIMIGQAAAGFCFPTVFVWINRALEGHDKGTLNGYCNALGALFRALFPPAADALLSLGLRSGLPLGRYLPVFANAAALLGCLSLAAAGARAQGARQVAVAAQPPPSPPAPAEAAALAGGGKAARGAEEDQALGA